jgi:hypothetical protein
MYVKIAYMFLMVRDREMVTMKLYWEVDIVLSKSDIGGPDGVFQGHEREDRMWHVIVTDGSMLAIGDLFHLMTLASKKFDLVP